MTVQTTYEFFPEIGIEGQIAEEPTNIASRSAENEIFFGRALVRGTNLERQCRVASGAVQPFLGISKRIFKENPIGGESLSYANKDTVAVVREGSVWVYTEQPVNAGDPVFYRHTTGTGGNVLGRFRKDADNTTAKVIVGAVFTSTRTTAGIARLRLPSYNQQ